MEPIKVYIDIFSITTQEQYPELKGLNYMYGKQRKSKWSDFGFLKFEFINSN